jgi:hypothetical protein
MPRGKMAPQNKGGMSQYIKTTKPVIEHVEVIESVVKPKKQRFKIKVPDAPPPPTIELPTPEKPVVTQPTNLSTSAEQVKLFVKALKEAQSPTVQAKERLRTVLGGAKMPLQERLQLELEIAQQESNEILERYADRYKIVGEQRVYKDPRYWNYLTRMKPMPPDATTAGDCHEMYQKVQMLSLFPNLFNESTLS